MINTFCKNNSSTGLNNRELQDPPKTIWLNFIFSHLNNLDMQRAMTVNRQWSALIFQSAKNQTIVPLNNFIDFLEKNDPACLKDFGIKLKSFLENKIVPGVTLMEIGKPLHNIRDLIFGALKLLPQENVVNLNVKFKEEKLTYPPFFKNIFNLVSLEHALKISNLEEKEKAFHAIYNSLAEGGENVAALGEESCSIFEDQIDSDQQKKCRNVWFAICRALIKNDDGCVPTSLFKLMKSPIDRERVILGVNEGADKGMYMNCCMQHILKGKSKIAIEYASLIADEFIRDNTVKSCITHILIKEGNLDNAIAGVIQIKNCSLRDEAFLNIVRLLAARDELSKGFEIVEKITCKSIRVRALRSLTD